LDQLKGKSNNHGYERGHYISAEKLLTNLERLKGITLLRMVRECYNHGKRGKGTSGEPMFDSLIGHRSTTTGDTMADFVFLGRKRVSCWV